MVSRLISTKRCLRCQFREVLGRTRLQRPPQPQCRGFSRSQQLCQDTSDDVLEKKKKKPYYWKHCNDGERVVGKPGRRQRVVSEGLSTTSLGRPANVIVFRDYKEEPVQAALAREDGKQSHVREDSALSTSSLSAQEIQNAITARHTAPRDEEVHASIDGLRPYETIQSQRAFDRLQQSLSKSYTFQQLSRYLVRSLRDAPSAVKSKNVRQLEASQWQPGQTPLQQRRNLVVKKTSATRKSALVDQILRLVWHITIHSEAQEIGELEIKVQPWQLSMLFDLADNGKPYYESLIGSKMLLDACELHSWPADSTLRIIGRRQDSEEVARQLKLAILGASRLDLDLKMFVPSIMKDAHRDDLSRILSDENIRYVSELTKTILDIRENGVIHIYGLTESARSKARRLLVALLQLPGPCSCTEILSTIKKSISRGERVGRSPQTTSPAANQDSGLHRRYIGFELRRSADQVDAIKGPPGRGDGVPNLTTEGTPKQELEYFAVPHIAKALSSHIDRIPELSTIPSGAQHDSQSYWRDQAQVDGWEAEYCTLLSKHSPPDLTNKAQESNKKTASQREPTIAANKLVVQRAVPGVETLLSYFETTNAPRTLQYSSIISSGDQDVNRLRRSRFDPQMPYLSAHFVPFTSRASTTALPRLEMRFRFMPSTSDQGGDRGLLLTKIKAILDTQTVMVPLPHHAVDVRFTRDSTLLVDTRAARQDKSIRAFVQRLQDSVTAGEGALDAPSELNFKLPHWLVHGSKVTATAKSDVEVPYLFERFEQTQRTVFTASENNISSTFLDTETQASVRSISGSMTLDYREVEGGAVYGRSTSLSIRTIKSSPRVSSDLSQECLTPLGDSHVDVESVSDDEILSHPIVDRFALIKSARGITGGGKQPIAGTDQSGRASLKLVKAALHFAGLLTRASSGSLLRMGEEERPCRGQLDSQHRR
ncbi:hypothetical protein DOTSEDRAFT_76807 [Dothistroma septosporum NZE10]|uniref:Uncharacterized protein n=1 Tax=Dothistroma septosporum (strain NZE10 / CBS 128990) TaxID=675120 RepID=N1Q2R0_DOTSN|nr:hypothetical protein DOTSEDRAFT_76807 [Dothistroma septosporum NZE10]